ncbi:RDD family protein [Marinilabiliaceae bacterium JC017]|nr:RDD family protein [Marinilabiliaceae bacterium JC017]
MDRSYQLSFCKKCTNRLFDPQKGILCKITRDKPSFEETCHLFHLDETIAEKVDREQESLKLTNLTASKSTRLLNHILDSIFVLILAFWVFTFLSAAGHNEWLESPYSLIISLLTNLFYYTFFESLIGQTPGKVITGTVVINKHGVRPEFGDCMIRTLSRLVPFEPISFLGDNSTGWHDAWTETQVVKKSYLQQ